MQCAQFSFFFFFPPRILVTNSVSLCCEFTDFVLYRPVSVGFLWVLQILFLTNPETWSAAAMYQATRIFSSNLTAALAQHFYNLILLPRLRDDIAEYRRLNFHLYMALKKSVFKSTAFFKGIVMPLCEVRRSTLRLSYEYRETGNFRTGIIFSISQN